jgi:hypothetical protein
MNRVLRLGFAGLCLAAAAAAVATAPPVTNPAWDKLKTLVGEWKGAHSGADGSGEVRLSYRLVSGGTGLMESMNSGHDENMVTVYSVDGNRILATHYCSAGNQPRMAAAGLSADGKTLTFRFVDATNVGPDSMVMNGLVVTFEGPDRLTQSWTSHANGKDEVGTFTYTRVP